MDAVTELYTAKVEVLKNLALKRNIKGELKKKSKFVFLYDNNNELLISEVRAFTKSREVYYQVSYLNNIPNGFENGNDANMRIGIENFPVGKLEEAINCSISRLHSSSPHESSSTGYSMDSIFNNSNQRRIICT